MRVAGDDLHLHGEYLRNCWYVAAWAHELIDGKLLARTILEQPLVLYKGDSGRAVALDDRCCHRGARLSKRPARGRLRALHVPRPEVRRQRRLRADPWAGHDSQGHGRAQLPDRRARFAGVDLDGRGRQGRRIADRRLPVPARAGLARRARLPALRRQLPADRRQPGRLRAPRVRASAHARRLGGVCVQDQAGRGGAPAARLSRQAHAHERRGATVSPQGDAQRRAHRPLERRHDAHPGHLLPRVGLRAGGLGHRAGRRLAGQAVPQLPVLHPRDRQAPRTSSGTTCTTGISTIRRSRCRCTTAWSRASTRTRRSSSSSRRPSTPTRRFACTRSPPTRRWRTFAACSRS